MELFLSLKFDIFKSYFSLTIMRFQTAFICTFISAFAGFVLATDKEEGKDIQTGTSSSIANKFPVSEFQQLLFTEVDDEIKVIQENLKDSEEADIVQERKLSTDSSTPEAQAIFDHIIDHAWLLSKSLVPTFQPGAHQGFDSRLLSTSPDEKEDGEIVSPYLVCSRSPLLQSGAQRLAPMLQFTGALSSDAIFISNSERQSCFQVSTSYQKALIVDSSLRNDEYVIMPMGDMMKIATNTFMIIEDTTWSLPSPEELFRLSLRGEEAIVEWERVVRVGLIPGLKLNITDVSKEAESILGAVKQMGIQGSLKNKRRKLKVENETSTDILTSSISDLFSLTSSLVVSKGRRTEVIATGRNGWTRALESGIESDHYCQVMFDQIEIRDNSDTQSFDIVLNPQNKRDEFMKQGLELPYSTSSNTDCVRSLIIGLSIHPHVLSIEAELPISADDFEAQWITQSNSQGSTPLYDRGLTGKGQIVSLSDSGLDVNHRYFGPTNDGVFQNWMMTERKVVKYDPIKGDKTDYFQGHGTRVAGVIAGNAGDEGDGVAKDAKIHIWDLQKEAGRMAPPGPAELFSAIYNGGKGAKITNASWSSGYRPYTFRCRLFDSFLSEKYNDILMVASAGNAANDVPGKVKNTIADPSSCKNILSVGASQSHGKRLFPRDKGKDYLADFSSRGPTADGRMKPDVVAPGYKVLAPRAHASKYNYAETYQTYGTSFSAPVVSGSAALIRQYFEEGWYPCGSKGCSKQSINPSGSLVKAILMNGAVQTVKYVQKVPAGNVLEVVREYDNNAGMGLINMVNSLPLKGVNEMNAFIINNLPINDGRSDYVLVKTKTCGGSMDSLRATLSWYDPAGSVNCVQCLINDLDLVVEKIGGTNNVEKTFYPNGLKGKDRKNNVERVRVAKSVSETFKITVKASNLATQNQKYSLVVTGCFDKLAEKRGI